VLKHEIPIKTVNAYSKVPQKSKASSNISEFEDLEAVPPMAESCREVEAACPSEYKCTNYGTNGRDMEETA